MLIVILFLIGIGVLIIIYGRYLFSQTYSIRKDIGLAQSDEIKYVDATNGIRTLFPKVLYSKKYKLKGKPDMIILKGEEFIPIEYKPNQEKIYKSNIMQLIAYCVLIEENYGKRPSHGILVLKDNKKVSIEFNNEKENELSKILDEMYNSLEDNKLPLDCFGNNKCNMCKYYKTCEELYKK